MMKHPFTFTPRSSVGLFLILALWVVPGPADAQGQESGRPNSSNSKGTSTEPNQAADNFGASAEAASALQDYISGKSRATPSRAQLFSASVAPREQASNLFDPFDIHFADIAADVDEMQEHSFMMDVDGTTTVNPSSPVSKELAEGRLPARRYDLILLWILNQRVDQQLLRAYLDKQNLAPASSDVTRKITMTPEGLKLEIAISGKGAREYIIPGVKSSTSEHTDRLANNLVNEAIHEIGLAAFNNRIDEIVTARDRAEFFPEHRIYTRDNVIAFLRSKAEITLRKPPEMDRAMQVQEREEQQQELEFEKAQLVHAYLKEHELLSPASVFKVIRTPRDNGIEIVITSEDSHLATVRSFVPANPELSDDSHEKLIGQQIDFLKERLAEEIGLRRLREQLPGLVAPKDRAEFFIDDKNIREQLGRYLWSKAHQNQKGSDKMRANEK